jgi:hypothetical protein
MATGIVRASAQIVGGSPGGSGAGMGSGGSPGAPGGTGSGSGGGSGPEGGLGTGGSGTRLIMRRATRATDPDTSRGGRPFGKADDAEPRAMTLLITTERDEQLNEVPNPSPTPHPDPTDPPPTA